MSCGSALRGGLSSGEGKGGLRMMDQQVGETAFGGGVEAAGSGE
jgi:hypothetical protein